LPQVSALLSPRGQTIEIGPAFSIAILGVNTPLPRQDPDGSLIRPREPSGTSSHGGPRTANESTFQKMLDPQYQIEDMDRRGIDINVISSATVIQGTSWADSPTDPALNQRCNDRVVEWVAKYPGRFIGSFTLPLQAVDLALGEMERAVKQLGMRVVNLCTQYRDVYVGDLRYRPFWEAADELDSIVWIHPDGVRDLWFQKCGMWNSIGQSIEEVKVMASINYDGVIDRFPNPNIVISHGGGNFPHKIGRMDRNVTDFPDSINNITRKPSEYLRSFYYDTCLYDPTVLSALVRCVGADRQVMGSDYPIGESYPIGFIENCAGISKMEAAMITSETPARLLGLSTVT
jgi:aminocarboxymuconate-semialdehyde decarboxylase